jgi:hypothetical protein
MSNDDLINAVYDTYKMKIHAEEECLKDHMKWKRIEDKHISFAKIYKYERELEFVVDLIEDVSETYNIVDVIKAVFTNQMKNKKVLGTFTCEVQGQIITEFIGLRPKMYSYTLYNSNKQCKKAKGVKSNVVKNELIFADYKKVLMDMTVNCCKETPAKEGEIGIKHVTFKTLRSMKHQIYTVEMCKVGLCAYDNKRFIIDGVNSLSYGHKDIQYFDGDKNITSTIEPLKQVNRM